MFATVFLWPHQFVARSIIFAVDLNPTKRVIRVNVSVPWEARRWLALSKHITVSYSSECWDLLKCWDRLQNVSTQTGVVGDLLTILRFHCKHYDSKEATVGLHFLIKFISLKRTWNAKSWHLKWKFAKLPPIPPQRHTFITSPSLQCYNNIFISYEWFLKQIFFTTQSQVVKCCQ